MFALLGLHAGPDIAVPAAASLAAVPLADARAALAELTRASLLTEDAEGRFSCHDLLRSYAAELAAATLGEAEREAAGRRVLDHYLLTAHAATTRLFPGHGRIELTVAADGVTPVGFCGQAAYDDALAWYGAEHRVLRNLIEQAAGQRHDEHCWKLAWCWASVLHRSGRVHEVLAAQQTAVLAAGRLGERDALAHVHHELGRAAAIVGDHQAADEHLRQALELFTDLADQPSIGMCRYTLGALFSAQERYDEALEHAMEALRLRRKLDDQASVASTENAVGWILAHIGQPEAGLWYCQRALGMHREAGSRTGVADTLDSMAFTYGRLGDHPRALAACDEALELYRMLGDSNGTACSLRRRGDLQFAAGDADGARDSWELALALLAEVPGASAGPAGRLTPELPAPELPAPELPAPELPAPELPALR